MSLCRTVVALISVISSLLFSQPVTGRVIEQVVVVVNGEPYTTTNLKTFAQTKMGREFPKGDLSQIGTEDKEVLENFITERLVAAEAQRVGIKVSEQDVDQYIEQLKSRNKLSDADLVEALRREGVTVEQYRGTVRSEIEKNELINNQVRQKVNITEEDIERYYRQNQKKFSAQEKIHLRHILLSVSKDSSSEAWMEAQQRAGDIRRRSLAGEDFGLLAQKYSEGAGGSAGGDLGWVNRGTLLSEIDAAASKLSIGGISEPVRSSLGVHLLKLEGRQGGEPLPLSEVKTSIREELYGKALEERFQRLLKTDLRKKHRVDVKIPGVVFRPEEKPEATVDTLMASSRRTRNQRSGLLSYLNPLSYITSETPIDENSDEKIVSVFGMPLFKTDSVDDNVAGDPLAGPVSAEPQEKAEKGFFSSILQSINPFSP
jgi:peptidyl-prolyl cis-trans isomerase SurA